MYVLRIKVLLQQETEQELQLRANFFGVSISSIILLHYLLYNDLTNISRDDFKEFDFDNQNDYRALQIDIEQSVINIYDAKPRFNYSVSKLLSVEIYKIVKMTKLDWINMQSEEKSAMSYSTYLIDEDVISKVYELKNCTGLTLTTIVNYSSFIDVSKEEQITMYDDEKTSKVKQGFQLCLPTKNLISSVLKIQTKKTTGVWLEKKLKKGLERLDKFC